MADQTVTFTVTDPASSTVIASGTLLYDASTDQIDGIAGTIDGNTITGLSTFDGSDNFASKNPLFNDGNEYYYNLDLDSSGLGFSTGDASYNINAANAPGNFEMTRQTGDTLVSSQGADTTVTFSSGDLYQPECFVSGTRIATLDGNVAVEELRAGDIAVTGNGVHRVIRWIGHRTIDLAGRSPQSWPVRIKQGAFGSDSIGKATPVSDLFLSPGHPVLVGSASDCTGGHLVPIMCLINGTTIERVPVDKVTYWHVELDQHDILLAEGLPAESYLDWSDRGFFEEGADHRLANPDFIVPGLAGRCRPVAIEGPVVEVERRRLDALFEMNLAAQCMWPTAEENAAV